MRLDPSNVWSAHLKGLTKHPTNAPDNVTRAVLWGVPTIVLIATWLLHAQLRQPAALLAGSSLLAGTLLASFGQLATLRGRLTDKVEVPQVARDALDETAAHVLVAVYAAVLTAGVLGVATSLSAGSVTGLAAALALAAGAWLLLLVLLVVPRLYQAYTYAYEVRDDLNGFVGREPRDHTRMH